MFKRLKRFFRILGPGFITGASDDDPSGIATYSQTGAMFGYQQAWTALFSFPFMTVVQEMCGRIGLVSGKGLAGVVKKNYSRSVLYFSVSLLLLANIVNIGADLGAMAASIEMLFGISFVFWLLLITVVTLILEIFISYKTYAKFLKYLAFSLLTYVLAAFVIKQDWENIFYSTLIPQISLNKLYLLNIVAILGTTISPYLFFWQSDEEVEEEIEKGKLRAVDQGIPIVTTRDLKAMRLDTSLGMFFSNLVMFFIIITAASTIGVHGVQNIGTATQAADALRPVAGDFAYLLFALGIVGTGLLAVPVLASSASYAVAESFGWKTGLYRKLNRAQGFYAVITVAIIIGLYINFTSVPPFKMLYYTAILNGVCAPPLLVLIMLIANNKNIMGRRTNSKISNILGWGIVAIMSVSAIALLFSLLL